MNENVESVVTEATDAVAEAVNTMEQAAAATIKPFADVAAKMPEFPFGEVDLRDTVRSYAEKGLDQTHQLFEQSKSVFDETASAVELVADRVQKGTTAFNAKLLDQTKANMTAGFEHLRRLTAAKSLPEVMELQTGFAKECAETLSAQAKALGEMTSKLTSDLNKPLQDHMSKAFSRLQTTV